MKPLLNVDSFLERFNHFKGGEFRSVKIISPTSIQVNLAGQDEARAFNWQTVTLLFEGVQNARLLEDTKYALLDMQDGISIIKDDNIFAFGVGECYNISNIKTASCTIESLYIKYKESSF